jgi:hypothetical protein
MANQWPIVEMPTDVSLLEHKASEMLLHGCSQSVHSVEQATKSFPKISN